MMRQTRRKLVLDLGASVLNSGGYVWSRFRLAASAAGGRVAGRSSTMATPFSTLEYAIAGSGPLVMIHGTGGGFDQGLRFAETLKRLGHQIIAPSRFGYLRSDTNLR